MTRDLKMLPELPGEKPLVALRADLTGALDELESSLEARLRPAVQLVGDYLGSIINCLDASKRHLLRERTAHFVELTQDQFGIGIATKLESLCLCKGMLLSLEKLELMPLPGAVKSLIVEEFRRVLASLENLTTPGCLMSAVENYDLHIALLRWIPVGVYCFEYSRTPRRNMLICPWKDKLGLLRFLVFRMKGLGPIVEMHLRPMLGRRFTREDAEYSHFLVARVLRKQANLKGIAGASWYTDPRVLRISPHLSFVRELFEKNGGFLHKLGPTNSATRNSILKSSRRRALYEAGDYVPMNYARYWARDDILRWAGLV